MADELIDGLDEEGRYVAPIKKSLAHKIGVWHRAVHIYLINDANELILQQRSPDKDLFPNFWDISVGGHVGWGEKTIFAAQRELGEELSVNAKHSEFEYLFTIKESFHQYNFLSREFVDVFLIEKDIKKEDIVLQKEEVSNFIFIPVLKFLDLIKNKDPMLVPHWKEYERIKNILEERYTEKDIEKY